MASQDAHDKIEKLVTHQDQVDAGLIPKDSPPTFVRPEGDDVLIDGLPWWFGGKSNYRPTPESLAEFSKGPE